MTSESGIDPRARELIEGLDLRPHPEGGFYRETFRSASVVSADGDRGVVSPGFDFADFRFLREQPDTLAQLMKADPSCAELT